VLEYRFRGVGTAKGFLEYRFRGLGTAKGFLEGLFEARPGALNFAPPRARSDFFLYGYLPQELGRELQQAAGLAGFYASLLRVDHVSDDAGAVRALLQSTVYGGVEWGTRAFLRGSIRSLHPPLQYIMVCLVGPPSRS
jgi:hypothetical protein